LHLDPASKKVFPGQTIRVSATVDFADEPAFAGKLRLEASGFAKSETVLEEQSFAMYDGPRAFVVTLDVEVAEG
jgi:hypothetical protein